MPSESPWFYLKYALSGDKLKFKAQAAHVLEKRHLGFEDIFGSLLQSSYLKSDATAQRLFQILSAGSAGNRAE